MGLDQTLFWRDTRLPGDPYPYPVNGNIDADLGLGANKIRQWRKYWDFQHRMHQYVCHRFTFKDGRDGFNGVCVYMGVYLLWRLVYEAEQEIGSVLEDEEVYEPYGTVCTPHGDYPDYQVTLEDTHKALKQALALHMEGKHVYYYCSR